MDLPINMGYNYRMVTIKNGWENLFNMSLVGEERDDDKIITC